MVDVPGSQEIFKMLVGLCSNEEYIPLAGSEAEEILEQRMHIGLHPSHVAWDIK